MENEEQNSAAYKKPPLGELLLNDPQQLTKLLTSLGVMLFEYMPPNDEFVIYNSRLEVHRQCRGYLASLASNPRINDADKPKITAILRGQSSEPAEVCIRGENGGQAYYAVSVVQKLASGGESFSVVGTIKDVTSEKTHELTLREQANCDPLTGLCNRVYGAKTVNEYLYGKGPFVSCGMLVIDIDYFKEINDRYGHLFGDTVLSAFAKLLQGEFDADDVVIRAGGDEFAVFIREISHTDLIRKVSNMLENVRALSFEQNDCKVTCSVGVCFLPENTFGYTYQQLFGDADWALYRAKNLGRDRYEFCDDLQRYESVKQASDAHHAPEAAEIDERYLHNDVVSTAFEIFEKAPNFDSAIHLLLKVAGIRLQLDRITVIRTDTGERRTDRSYIWTAPGVPEVLSTYATFTQDDFLTLFRSYDSYGTTVLHYDDMDMYSEGAQALLMQGGAKTVVYAAMYCDGHYSGAVSFVTCDSKRHWSQSQRCQLGELTKIISAHMARSQVINYKCDLSYRVPDFDSLTGLMSFTRFREEAERMIVGNRDEKFVLIYSDFENFKFFNRRYGYRHGDHLLKRYAAFVAKNMLADGSACFARVVSDQFVLLMQGSCSSGLEREINELNHKFEEKYSRRYNEAMVRLRCGVYCVEPDCPSASVAIDAANYARLRVKPGTGNSVRMYSPELERAQTIENELLEGMSNAFKNNEFEIYLQPKYNLRRREIVGAEALVRWRRPDGSLLLPNEFVPVYERAGRILDLNYYVFEQVAQFLAKNDRLGRRQLPISINATILSTANANDNTGTVQHYLDILRKYGVDPSLTEVELPEMAAVAEHDEAVALLEQFRNVDFLTTLDGFGAGHSILNAVLNIPVDTVKIDRTFLTCCEQSEKGVYLFKQMVGLIKGLGYNALCEGIETESELELLLDAGCEMGQGFLFSRPLPIPEYEKLVYGE